MRSILIRLVIALLLAILISTLSLVKPALAGDDDSITNIVRVTGRTTDTGYEADVTGSRSFGDTVTGPGVPGWLRECRWLTWSEADKDAFFATHFGSGRGPDLPPLLPGDPGPEWGAVFCNPGPEASNISPGIDLTGLLGTWPLDDDPPQIVQDVLIARAYASVDLPLQLGQSAPFGDVDAPMITQLPTWIWVDPNVWAPRSASPAEVFGITVTVTATPSNITFEGADGEIVDCGANLGPAYNFALPDDAQRSDCTVTYRHSSAVGDWTLRSTLTWEADYICSSVCGSGTLPDYVVTTTRDVRVAELQAVLVGKRPTGP